jgi:hypothetical protein
MNQDVSSFILAIVHRHIITCIRPSYIENLHWYNTESLLYVCMFWSFMLCYRANKIGRNVFRPVSACLRVGSCWLLFFFLSLPDVFGLRTKIPHSLPYFHLTLLLSRRVWVLTKFYSIPPASVSSSRGSVKLRCALYLRT